MSTRKIDSKVIGLFFILPILFYGIGNSLVEPIFTLKKSFSIPSGFQFGGLLMIANSITVICIGILLYPKIKKYHKSLAITYLVTRIIEALLLIVGIISIFSLIPLGQSFVETELDFIEFQKFRTFAFGVNYYSYQISMLFLGFGSVPFCYLMYKEKFIPGYLALSGCLGYGLLFAGSISEFLGYNVGIFFSIPGGLFELSFGLWLIIKGFQTSD